MTTTTTLVIATRNRHKAQEIQDVLGARFAWLMLADLAQSPAVVEDAGTFAGNARKKAVELARWLAIHPPPARGVQLLVLADDSGLEVDALDGAPGVHSARFAALESGGVGNSTDLENNTRLLRLLHSVPLEKRQARFRCVVAVTPLPCPPAGEDRLPKTATHGEVRLFEGVCEGRILLAPRGRGGFGYDPLFEPQGFAQSFAELGEAIKNQISHRAQALAKLREWLAGRA